MMRLDGLYDILDVIYFLNHCKIINFTKKRGEQKILSFIEHHDGIK